LTPPHQTLRDHAHLPAMTRASVHDHGGIGGGGAFVRMSITPCSTSAVHGQVKERDEHPDHPGTTPSQLRRGRQLRLMGADRVHQLSGDGVHQRAPRAGAATG